MKKYITIMAAALAVAATSCGTGAKLTPAEALVNGDKPNFAEARRLAEEMRTGAETKSLASSWFASGAVENKYFTDQLGKMMLPGMSADTVGMYTSLVNSVPYFVEALQLDEKPNAEGKVNPIYTKKIADILKGNLSYFVSAGDFFMRRENFKEAQKAYLLYNEVRHLPIFKDDASMQVEDSTSMGTNFFAIYSAYAGKDWDGVIKMAKPILNVDYNRDEVYQMLASAYSEKKDTVNMLNILKEGAKIFTNSPYYLSNIVQIYALQGKFNDAIDYLKQAIAADQKNVNYLNFMGQLYEQKEDWKEAASWYEKALAVDAEDFAANYNLARSLYNQGVELLSAERLDKLTQEKGLGFYKKSLPFFEKAYQKAPAQVYYVLGNVYDALGMSDKAQAVRDTNK